MKEDIFEHIANIDEDIMTEEEINNEKIEKYPKLLNKYYELLQKYKKCKEDNINRDEDVVLEIEYLNNIEKKIKELYEKHIIIECIIEDKQKESYYIRNKIEQLKIKTAKIQNKPKLMKENICKYIADIDEYVMTEEEINNEKIKKLSMLETITPLTGEDSEWSYVTEQSNGKILYQNKRNSAVFKDEQRAWYLDAIVWSSDTYRDSVNICNNFYGTVGGIKSRQYIKEFPFQPKTFYINVTRENLPSDWEEEPFFEDKDYYITSDFESTGVKNWIKGDKYRYVIKDMKQLDKVFEYYK